MRLMVFRNTGFLTFSSNVSFGLKFSSLQVKAGYRNFFSDVTLAVLGLSLDLIFFLIRFKSQNNFIIFLPIVTWRPNEVDA
jgi:hypothetical protein